MSLSRPVGGIFVPSPTRMMSLWFPHPTRDTDIIFQPLSDVIMGPCLTPNSRAFLLQHSLFPVGTKDAYGTCSACNNFYLRVAPNLEEIHVNRLSQSSVINAVVSLGRHRVLGDHYKLFDLGQALASHSKL